MNITRDMGNPLFVTQNVTDKIRVLLVDHDSNHDALIAEMFGYFSCEVTIVKLASTALSILSKGKSQFDLVMENVLSPDSYGFRLLQEAVKMDLPVILLTDEDDPIITMRGIEEGAILCLQKPITMELIKYLWQHVLREKICKTRENERIKESMELHKLHGSGIGHEHNNGSVESKKKTRSRTNSTTDEQRNVQDRSVGKSGKKGWIEWTQELHEKFLDAVRQLGEGSCYPKEILDLMNAPGLKRMQVASHLQKCRYGDWQLNYLRKHNLDFNPETTSLHFYDIPPAKSRRFGTMPRLGDNSQLNQEHAMNQVENSSTRNNILEHASQVPINQEDYDGYIHFGNIGSSISLNDMFTCDAESGTCINTSPNDGMNCNGQLQELDMDQVHHQISYLLETTTDQQSHEASNSE